MKKCCRCHEIKPISSFSRKKSSKDGHRNICRSCHTNYTRESRRKKKQFALELLGNVCVDCGLSSKEHDYGLFDFHHTDPSIKGGEIAGKFQDSKSTDIEDELKKCVILCKSCHAKRHRDYERGLRPTL